MALGVVGTLAFAGIVKYFLLDDEAGDPNQPEVIERNERLAAADKSNNLTNDGNWGRDKPAW
jgi:hypothetical protein